MKKVYKKNKKIVFFSNDLQYFFSHRHYLAKSFLKRGFKVYLLYGSKGNINQKKLRLISNLKLINCPFKRGGLNPFKEIHSLINTYKLIKRIKPDLVHLINLKPYLYGGLATMLLSIPSVSSITGLGFTNNKVYDSKIYKFLIIYFLKILLNRHRHKIIVQNSDDRFFLINNLKVKKEKIFLIKGTGINFKKYKFTNLPKIPYKIIFPARFIKEKGILDFVEAAKLLKVKYPKIEFLLVGELDQQARAFIDKQKLKDWQRAGLIKLIGYKSNISQIFSQAHIICLPSYQEGFPRVLLEAAACGRAVITTDVPGCRESILPNKTGLLVKPRDPFHLALNIEKLINNKTKLKRMSFNARKFAEKNFNEAFICSKHNYVYSQLNF